MAKPIKGHSKGIAIRCIIGKINIDNDGNILAIITIARLTQDGTIRESK